ncbi:hydrolase 76 protein [Dinochytrium kinnereticum]|nr:hydrolase 76 protein [Dinochytrium kinnereticum]
MPWLGYHYVTPGDGAWDQKLIQWHESGAFWNCYLDYRQTTGDTQYDGLVGLNMKLASFGDTGDFLDGANRLIQETLYGKWNDDIGWWALAAVTGAEIWGTESRADTNATNPGRPWFYIAQATLNQMYEQYDGVCGGGLYWSRNRFSDNIGLKAYKSVISNVQGIQLAGRLLALNPSNTTFRDFADRTYDWLISSTLLLPDYRISDGVTAINSSTCGEAWIDRNEWSYQPGVLMSGLAYLFKATNDQKYMIAATNVFESFSRVFVRSTPLSVTIGTFPARVIGEVWEPMCETNSFRCKDPAGYAWAAFRGMTHLYRITTNETLKQRITFIVESSASALASRCDDSWNCIRTLTPVPSEYTFPNGTNPRDQIEAVTILNALAAVRGIWAVRDTPTTSSTGAASSTTSVPTITGTPQASVSVTQTARTTTSSAFGGVVGEFERSILVSVSVGLLMTIWGL